MLELPNYSSQLMQQLWALKKGGHFCDCTVFVGDSPHRAHKLLLAASSMLFRSLLASSDTISIDTAVVTSQEFSCLLDMVYTGKLPLGKHNVTRIIAAADNLQMFDVAIGFKKVLTTIVSPQPSPTEVSTQNPSQKKTESLSADSPTEPTKDLPFKESESPTKRRSSSQDQSPVKKKKDENQKNDDQCNKEPACESACPDQPESSESEETLKKERKKKKKLDERPSATGILEQFSVIMDLFINIPTIRDLLSQAANNSLDQKDRQVVLECCEQSDPENALGMLLAQVKKGVLGEAALVALLWAVHQNIPSSTATQLQHLLQNLESSTPAQSQHQDTTCRSSVPEDTKEEVDENSIHKDSDYELKDSASFSSSTSSTPSTPKPYTCHSCKRTFNYKCRLLAHTKRCSKSTELKHQCPQCPQKLPTQQALLRHQAETHKYTIKKKIECELCGRKFAHPSGMIYHMRTEHFEEKPFTCKECGANFGANSSLKNHMRLHTGEKPYACKHCDMSFAVAAGLAYHTKKKHSEGKMYVCQYCKAEFAQSIELTRHVRTHTGDRPYVCRECGKGYSQASGLTAHLLTTHNISEPYDCQKCCLSFSSLSEHEHHIRDVHPSEFHKCPVCEKVFPTATLLNKHKSTHAGSKLFSCDLCNKSYQQLSGLWYHNRTNHPDIFTSHTRQLSALVQCDICFKFFPSDDSLAQHQAIEHQGSVGSSLRCPFCPATLTGEDWMHEHISTHHAQQSEVTACSHCSLLCGSVLELQEHIRSLHMGSQEEEAPTSEVPAEKVEEGGTGEEQVSVECVLDGEESSCTDAKVSEGQAHLENIQQVFVALANGQEGSQVVEVSMFDLLNNTVTFICEDKAPESSTQP